MCVCMSGFIVDPGSSLGRLRLLTEQNAELVNKQQSLESELLKQNTLQKELQERTKSASLHPDEMSSQQLSTLFHESHCESSLLSETRSLFLQVQLKRAVTKTAVFRK